MRPLEMPSLRTSYFDIIYSAEASTENAPLPKFLVRPRQQPNLNPAGYQHLFSTKIQNSTFGRASGRLFNFGSYQHLFSTKTQNSKFGRTGGPILNSVSYHFEYETRNSKFGRAGGRNLNFASYQYLLISKL